ncbi:MAG: hypothetical protein ACPG4W_08875, partial [Flavobacteriales bacterium]
KYGVEYCYELSIDDVEFKKTKKSWTKKISDLNTIKPSATDNDIEFYDVKYPNISVDTLNVYTRIIERSGAIVVQSYFQSENGFISDSNDVSGASSILKKDLMSFGKKEYNALYFSKIESEFSVLKRQNKILKSLKNDIVRNEKLIRKRNESINDNEQEISNLKPEIATATHAYEEKQKAFSTLSERSDVHKVELKKLKEAERNMKKLVNTKNKLSNDIVKFRSHIEDAKQEIATLRVKIETQGAEIEEQKALIEQLNQKIIN